MSGGNTDIPVAGDEFCFAVHESQEVFMGREDYPSFKDAAYGFFKKNPESTVWVGLLRSPIAPEECIDADDLIEKVLCQDDYSDEESEWPLGGVNCITQEQLEDLTQKVRAAFGEWIDANDFRPTHRIVHEVQKFERADFPDLPQDLKETFIFFRKGGFYPIEILRGDVFLHANNNPGTLRVEDIHGNILWEAKP